MTTIPIFDQAIRWTGYWTADDYDDATGIAIGQKSFGPSGGRNTGPSAGSIPARVLDVGLGHYYFECRNSLETWLTTDRLMDEFLGNGRAHMFYAVLEIVSQEDVGDGSTAPCVMIAPSGADGVKFGRSFGGAINTALQASGVGTLTPFLWNATVTNVHGVALGEVGLYEAFMDPRPRVPPDILYAERSSWSDTEATSFFTNGRGPQVSPVPGSPIAELFHGSGAGLSERWLDANVYEIRISDVCYPPSTRAKIRAELMAKYGITP